MLHPIFVEVSGFFVLVDEYHPVLGVLADRLAGGVGVPLKPGAQAHENPLLVAYLLGGNDCLVHQLGWHVKNDGGLGPASNLRRNNIKSLHF